MEAINNLVDINAYEGEMEGEAFLEECIALKEGMVKINERYMNLLYDIYHLLMVDEMYHYAVKKEEEESERLNNKL